MANRWKVPKKVNILGLDYRIKELKKPIPIGKHFEKSAYIDYNKLEIAISKKQRLQEMQLDMLHEIVHGILWSIEATLNIKERLHRNEELVDLLSKALFASLKEAKIIQS